MTSPAWVRKHVDSVLAVVVAMALLDVGTDLRLAVAGEGALATVAVIAVHGAALGLVVLAAAGVDIAERGHLIAGIVFAILAVAYVTIYTAVPRPLFGTDAMLFQRAAADALLAGQNPYAIDLTTAWERYGATVPGTMRVDGSVVGSFSYPAGAVLAVVPQAATVGGALSLTPLVAMLAITGVLIWASPSALALAPIVLIVFFRDLHMAAIGGVIDPIWVLPALLAMVAYRHERYLWGAVALGIAVSIKQQAWFLVPFAVVWLWASAEDATTLRQRLWPSLAVIGGVFAWVNLPFLLTDPQAWVGGVFVALLGTTIVPMGVGPSLLTVTGAYPLTALWYFGLMTFGGALALTAYALYWPRLKWVGWFAPALLLFLPHRSLASYLTFVLPLAYYAVLCETDLQGIGGTGVQS